VTSLISVALLAPALAAEVSEYTGAAGSVGIAGPVDVPLYACPDAPEMSCVEVTILGKKFLFGLLVGRGIHILPRAAAALELEPKEKTFRHYNGGEPIHYASVPKITIGDDGVEINEVWVSTDPPASPPDRRSAHGAPSPISTDGYIGLQSLPELAWAIMPSQGKAIFAPADQGRDLIDSFQSEIIRYRWTPEEVEVYGKNSSGAIKERVPAGDLIIPVTIGDQSAEVTLSFLAFESALRSDRQPTPTAIDQIGNEAWSWQPVQVGGQQPTASWIGASGAYRQRHDSAYRNNYADGHIGRRVLGQLDMAADPSNRSITFRTAPQNQRRDPLDLLLADARASTEDAGEGDTLDAAAWTRLGDIYHTLGRLDDAISAYTTVTEDKEAARACTSWLKLADAQHEAYRIDGAAASYEKTSAQFHDWWDLSLEDREARKEALDDVAEGEEPPAGPMPQASACFVADSRRAAIHLARGEADAVTALYSAHLDLDEDLAIAAGNAWLAQGDLDAAQAAYRQANQLAKAPTPAARLGLALAYEAAGDRPGARGLYENAIASDDSDTMGILMWLDAEIRATSPQAALRKALAFRRANPDSPGAYVAIARAAAQAGDEEERKNVTAAGDAFFARYRAQFPHKPALAANQALFLLETGRLTEARALAEVTLLEDPASTLSWLALGNVYVLQGDTDRGERLFRRAGRLDPLHPGYALLINAAVPRPTADAEGIDP